MESKKAEYVFFMFEFIIFAEECFCELSCTIPVRHGWMERKGCRGRGIMDHYPTKGRFP